jgi:hypothetical protein
MKPNMPIKTLQNLIQKNMEGFWRQAATTKHIVVQSNSEYTNTVSKIPDALFNSVLSTNLGDTDTEKKIALVKSNYNQQGLSFCWWISENSTPASLGKQLEAQKFQLFGEVQGMALDLSTANFSAKLPKEATQSMVKTKADFANWIKPLAISFHMSDTGADGYKQIFEDLSISSQNVQHYVAFIDEKPVASCSFYLDKEAKSVGVYNCATTPEARKKGIVSALTCHGLFAAYKDGYETAVLQASPMSKDLFEKMGFESCSPYKVYLG